MPGINKPRPWRIPETAKYFGVSERTVRRWIESGTLQAVKVGGIVRVPEESALKLIYPHLQGYQHAGF